MFRIHNSSANSRQTLQQKFLGGWCSIISHVNIFAITFFKENHFACDGELIRSMLTELMTHR